MSENNEFFESLKRIDDGIEINTEGTELNLNRSMIEEINQKIEKINSILNYIFRAEYMPVTRFKEGKRHLPITNDLFNEKDANSPISQISSSLNNVNASKENFESKLNDSQIMKISVDQNDVGKLHYEISDLYMKVINLHKSIDSVNKKRQITQLSVLSEDTLPELEKLVLNIKEGTYHILDVAGTKRNEEIRKKREQNPTVKELEDNVIE